MSPDIVIESRHMGYALWWGFKLAIFYDAILIMRNVIKHKNLFWYMEDLVYWIFCALFVFENIYEIGDGYIRWYIALGVGIGMLFYKLTISRWLVKYVSFLLNKIKEFILKGLSVLIRPFIKIGHKIKAVIRFIKIRIRTLYRLLKKKLTLTLKMLKIALNKSK